MTDEREYFSSRWGLLFTTLGMVIGAGNIWRFPRIAAQNGGGAFLLAWVAALFLWSIPILIIEFGIGRHTRLGVIGAFGKLLQGRLTWMGLFISFCTAAIMFYYSVVAGWCIRYAIASFSLRALAGDPAGYWMQFTSGPLPVLFHLLAMVLAGAVVYRGVNRGIERVNRIMIPLLFILLVSLAVRALFLPGAERGLHFLFHPQWGDLLHSRIWLEALSQSAWSAGPGWGLLLTYAVYSRRRDDATLNSIFLGFGNNVASILAGIAVLCTLFALVPGDQAMEAIGQGNIGLTFIWLPQLFVNIPAGAIFMFVFFLAMTLAAISSLISMIEMVVRIIMDAGFSRRRALVIVVAAGFGLGIPSSLSLGFFANQDWVWGLGLIVSGFFMAVAVNFFGVRKFRNEIINVPDRELTLGRWFDILVRWIIPIEFIGLLGWWFYQSITVYQPGDWWNPLRSYSLGSTVIQWGAVIILGLLLSRKLYTTFCRD
ncbi:sodium-dependent transporter [candidate division KSB1 bacterium]